MAASVNNISATFAAARFFPPPPSSSISSPSPSPPITAAFSSSTSTPRPISASWNPQSALPRSHRSSLLGLYGLPGPRPSLFRPQSPRLRPLPSTISIGDRLPNAVLSYLDETESIRTVSLSDLTRGRKTVIMAVPGAFAPPPRPRWCCRGGRGAGGGVMTAEGLVRRAGELREKGGEGAARVVVACVAANDVYVMRAWGEKLGSAEGGVMMLSDPDAELARSLGLTLDLRGGPEGFGVRSEGYCMVAVNGVVRALFLNNGHNGGGSGDSASAAGFDDVLRVL